jgi:hypothetical protein
MFGHFWSVRKCPDIRAAACRVSYCMIITSPTVPVPSLSVIDNKQILARDGNSSIAAVDCFSTAAIELLPSVAVLVFFTVTAIFCVVDEMDGQDLSGFCLDEFAHDVQY